MKPIEKSKQLSAAKAFEAIEQHAKENACDDFYNLPRLKVGQFFAQGDINVWRIPSIPENAIEEKPREQLVPSTSKGSRHTIHPDDLQHVRQFRLPRATPLHGPLLIVSSPIRNLHPEHRDLRWQPGTYAITYQRSFADELERVAD